MCYIYNNGCSVEELCIILNKLAPSQNKKDKLFMVIVRTDYKKILKKN